MQQSFIKQVAGINLEFYRFYNNNEELQYVAAYKLGTDDELLLLLSLNEKKNWEFIYKDRTPVELTGTEIEINALIKNNEASQSTAPQQ